MNRIRIVMRRDYREHRQAAGFRIMLIIMAAVTVAAAAGISIALALQSWTGDPEARPILGLFIGLVLYFLPLFILLAFIWAFGNLPVTREKANGNIDALMASPVSPRELWLGKSLAIYIPAYIIAFVAAVIVVLVINLGVLLPAGAGFVLPLPALALGLVMNPLLFLALLLFMQLFALTNNPDIAMAPSFILGFGLMMGMPVGLGMGWFDILSWSFALWYLLGTAVLLGAVLLFSLALTRQNIVLSSKGT